jgi:hypothetical protein
VPWLRVSRRPLIAASWIRLQVTLYEMCGGQSGTGQAFLPALQFSPVSIILPMPVTHPLYVALTRTNGRILGTFAKAISSPKSGSIWQTSADTYCFERWRQLTTRTVSRHIATLQIISTNKVVTSHLRSHDDSCTAYERPAVILWQWRHNRAIPVR